LFQGIDEGDAQWLEMALIGSQNGQSVRGGSGGNGNVLETGIIGARAVENQAGVTCLFDIERQDASGIEMLDGGKPAAQLLRLGRCGESDGAGDARLDLGNSDRLKIEPVTIRTHPSRERLHADLALGRRIGRYDVRVQKIHGQGLSSFNVRAGFRDRSGMSPASPGKASSRSAKLGTLDTLSHSSKETSTASLRPWRVMTVGSPPTARSTTAESVALASLS
jgi:hypothetical protein